MQIAAYTIASITKAISFTEAWPMAAKRTQLRERANTVLVKFHCIVS